MSAPSVRLQSDGVVVPASGFAGMQGVFHSTEFPQGSTSSVLDNSRGLRYNTLNVVIKGYYALNVKEGKMSWQIRNIF